MPLLAQAARVQLTGGLDTKTDPKQVVPGKLVLLENGVLTTLGEVRKRNGHAALPQNVAGSSGTVGACTFLAGYRGDVELVMGGGSQLYALSAAGWTAKGTCEALSISARPAVRNQYQQTSPDLAVHPSGVTVVAWEDSSGGARYSVLDSASGQPVVYNQALGTNGARPKCLVLGNYVVVIYYEQAVANHLRYVAVPATSPWAVAAPVDLAVDCNANQVFDAAVSGNRLLVAYANTSGASNQLSLRYLTNTLSLSAESATWGVSALPTVVAVWVDPGQNWWISFYTSAVFTFAVDYNLTTSVFGGTSFAATGVRNVTGIAQSAAGVAPVSSAVLYEVGATPSYNSQVYYATVAWAPLPPTLNSATPGGGGTLGAGTYYYVVTALGTTGETTASNELSATVGASGSVALTWSAPPGVLPTGYRVYRGTASGGENVYYAPGNVTSFTDTGAAGTSGTPQSQNTFASVFGPNLVRRSVGLASKPWIPAAGRQPHFVAGYSSALQSTYFVLTTGGSVVGYFAPGVAGGVTAKAGILPEAPQPQAGVVQVAHLRASTVNPSGPAPAITQTGVWSATLDFTVPQQAQELSGNLHVTGGLLWSFDGAQVAEHNFLLFPENVAAAVQAGGSLLVGQYQYAVVFEWTDAQGLVHQSAPSVPVTVATTTGNQQVQLTVPTLRLTNKATPVTVVVYRTAVNGTVFYRLTPPSSPLLNSTTVDTVTYTDSVADSTIIGNLQLYTTGGEVDNSAAPAPLTLATYGSRLMLVPSEDPGQVWFSKQAIPGVPVEFSQSFAMAVDQRGGGITALAEMDGTLVVFKRDWIFALAGDGPAPNGTPSPPYPPAQLISSTVGCVEPRSLALVPRGLTFRSRGGTYLLDRALQVSYLGAPVEGYNSGNVVGAVRAPGQTQVRYALDSGVVLCYDWLVEQWSVFTGIQGAAATVYGGLFAYATAAGLAYQEAPGTFTDAGQPIRLRVQTGWLSLAGLQGLQRLWALYVLGDYKSAHRLRVSLAFDWATSPLQVVDVDAASLLGGNGTAFGADSPFGAGSPFGGSPSLYQLRVKPVREKCQAVQVTIEDTQVKQPYGEGMSLSALGLKVGVMAPLAPVPTRRTAK